VKRLTDLHLPVQALLAEYNLCFDHRLCNAGVVQALDHVLMSHDVIQHRYPATDQLSLGRGFHSRRSPIQVLTVPMLPNFCTQLRGNRCFNIVRSLDLEFGLLCMIRATQCGHSHDMSSLTQSHPSTKPFSNSDLPVAWITTRHGSLQSHI
jgi:hypothetical protein